MPVCESGNRVNKVYEDTKHILLVTNTFYRSLFSVYENTEHVVNENTEQILHLVYENTEHILHVV